MGYESNIKSNLYLIQGSSGTPVKIGMAVFPTMRLKELQTGNWDKLRILMLVRKCPRGLESIVHKELSDFRISGEWFDPKILQDIDVIEDFIWTIASGHFESIEYLCLDLGKRSQQQRNGMDKRDLVLNIL